MAGRAFVIGAAVCPKVDLVGAFNLMVTGDGYNQMAAAFLMEPDRLPDLTTYDDPSTAAAATWITTRKQRPDLRRQWRTDGVRRLRLVSAVRSRSGGSASVEDDTARRRREAADKTRRRSMEKARRKQGRRGR